MNHERIDPHYMAVLRQLIKQVGVDRLRQAITEMYSGGTTALASRRGAKTLTANATTGRPGTREGTTK